TSSKCVALSPLLATLSRPVTPKSFVCHSYEKTPGVGYPLASSLAAPSFASTLYIAITRQSRCHCSPCVKIPVFPELLASLLHLLRWCSSVPEESRGR